MKDSFARWSSSSHPQTESVHVLSPEFHLRADCLTLTFHSSPQPSSSLFPSFSSNYLRRSDPELSSASSNDGCNDSVAELMYLLFVIYPHINHVWCRRASDKWAVRKSMGVRCLKACIYHHVMITCHYC